MEIGPKGFHVDNLLYDYVLRKVCTHTVPVLGIGHGFYTLCQSHGASIHPLSSPQHGNKVAIEHSGNNLFDGMPDLHAVLFQSFRVDLGHSAKDLKKNTPNAKRWKPSGQCPDLVPLAWHTPPESVEPVLMAVCHKTKPFWGFQFRPEFSGSDPNCRDIFKNWLAAVRSQALPSRHASSAPSVKHQTEYMDSEAIRIAQWLSHKFCTSSSRVFQRVIPMCDLTSDIIGELIDVPNAESVVLVPDSRFTIMSVISPGAWRLEYSMRTSQVCAQHLLKKFLKSWLAPKFNIYATLQYIASKSRVKGGHPDVPFWGGFMGFFSYEMGSHKWAQESKNGVNGDSDDACFLWVERSIVIDHKENYVYIQSLRGPDNVRGEWLDLMMFRLMQFSLESSLIGVLSDLAMAYPADISQNIYFRRLQYSEDQWANLALEGAKITVPSNKRYKNQISMCKEFVQKGSVYEVYPTHEATIELPPCNLRSDRNLRHWLIYKRLRKLNPTVDSAYAKIGRARIVSCGTSDVLGWDRNLVIMRYDENLWNMMAGVFSENEDQIEANSIIKSTDLACSEITQLYKARNATADLDKGVDVSTTFIQPTTKASKRRKLQKPKRPPHDVEMARKDYVPLGYCLPFASMTGIPQRGAFETLDQHVEKRLRGLYSGAIGYYDVGRGASFSLLSRTAFSWSNGNEAEVWTVGAGAKITALTSTKTAMAEMKANLNAVLPIFEQCKVNDAEQMVDEMLKKFSEEAELVTEGPDLQN